MFKNLIILVNFEIRLLYIRFINLFFKIIMNNTTPLPNPTAPNRADKVAGSGSFLKTLSRSRLLILALMIALLLAVIIFLIVGLAKKSVPALPSPDQNQEQSGQNQMPTPPVLPKAIKITSYAGKITDTDINSASVQLSASPEQNAGLSGAVNIKININKQTVLIQRIRPEIMPPGIDPSTIFKQSLITLKDLAVGDEIIASAGGEDLSGKTEFTAKSIMKAVTVK